MPRIIRGILRIFVYNGCMTILIVEDEKKLNQMIADYLQAVGHRVRQAYDGFGGLKMFEEGGFDFIVLDLAMPGIDGLDLLRRIRLSSQLPVIMLTARSGEQDMLIGLELGADDYITKPFSMKELEARIRAVYRRGSHHKVENIVKSGIFEADKERREIRKRGEVLQLTTVQFNILLLMMKSPGRVFSRIQLLQAFQDLVFEGYERTIDVHIKNIRKIVEENPSQPKHILTIRGVGYKFIGEDI